MHDNRNRVYALSGWTVKSNGRGWFIRKTDSAGEWRGPYANETSVCLMIARQLRKELVHRDAPPPQLPL